MVAVSGNISNEYLTHQILESKSELANLRWRISAMIMKILGSDIKVQTDQTSIPRRLSPQINPRFYTPSRTTGMLTNNPPQSRIITPSAESHMPRPMTHRDKRKRKRVRYTKSETETLKGAVNHACRIKRPHDLWLTVLRKHWDVFSMNGRTSSDLSVSSRVRSYKLVCPKSLIRAKYLTFCLYLLVS